MVLLPALSGIKRLQLQRFFLSDNKIFAQPFSLVICINTYFTGKALEMQAIF